jgi:hypothetical protein
MRTDGEGAVSTEFIGDDGSDSSGISGRGTGTGLITQPRERSLAPALLAEQQRARTEIEAALTIAAHRPRDQKEAVDRILTSCQRPGLAAKAKYRYSRGGTDIVGVTIDLMETVAQNWGNIEFGFRELARFPSHNGAPSESVVEAFAWDLETNTRRKVQFTVQHVREKRSGNKNIDDPREIYELVANQAQRRVRTCLENIIPRDVVESAADECEKTMRANVGDINEASVKLVDAFAKFGVTKDMLEARMQRRLDTISAAQVVWLRSVWAGLRDGVSKPEDWFDVNSGNVDGEKQTAADKAKAAMRKNRGEGLVASVEQKIDGANNEVHSEDHFAVDGKPIDEQGPSAGEVLFNEFVNMAGDAATLTHIETLKKQAVDNIELQKHPTWLQKTVEAIEMAGTVIRGKRGGRA